MTNEETITAWARRMAEREGVASTRFIVECDGYVYAMPDDPAEGAVAWWPLPPINNDGTRALSDSEDSFRDWLGTEAK